MPLNIDLRSDNYRLIMHNGRIFKFWIHIGNLKCLRKLKSRQYKPYIEIIVKKCITLAMKKSENPDSIPNNVVVKGDGFCTEVSFKIWKLSEMVEFNNNGKILIGFKYQLRLKINIDESDENACKSSTVNSEKESNIEIDSSHSILESQTSRDIDDFQTDETCTPVRRTREWVNTLEDNGYPMSIKSETDVEMLESVSNPAESTPSVFKSLFNFIAKPFALLSK